MTETIRANGAEQNEFITCRIGEEEYCADIMTVREIRGWTPATKLPHVPSFVCGVINLRGAVLPVIDLAARLQLGSIEATARHVIIIVQLREQTVGLLVDAVSDILCAKEEEVHPTPSVASETAREFVSGLIMVDERTIRILNLERLVPEIACEAA